jgi:hypothetical protein
MVSSFFFSVLEVLCLVAAVSGSEKAATTTTTTTRSLRAEDPRYLDNSRIVGGDQLNAVDVPQYRSYAIPTAGSLCGGYVLPGCAGRKRDVRRRQDWCILFL